MAVETCRDEGDALERRGGEVADDELYQFAREGFELLRQSGRGKPGCVWGRYVLIAADHLD